MLKQVQNKIETSIDEQMHYRSLSWWYMCFNATWRSLPSL